MCIDDSRYDAIRIQNDEKKQANELQTMTSDLTT